MTIRKPRGDAAPGFAVHVTGLPAGDEWQATAERLHRLTLHGLGGDVASVYVALSVLGDGALPGDVECRLRMRLRRERQAVEIATRHPDAALALTQAFTRAQREAQRHFDTARRLARRRYLDSR